MRGSGALRPERSGARGEDMRGPSGADSEQRGGGSGRGGGGGGGGGGSGGALRARDRVLYADDLAAEERRPPLRRGLGDAGVHHHHRHHGYYYDDDTDYRGSGGSGGGSGSGSYAMRSRAHPADASDWYYSAEPVHSPSPSTAPLAMGPPRYPSLGGSGGAGRFGGLRALADESLPRRTSSTLDTLPHSGGGLRGGAGNGSDDMASSPGVDARTSHGRGGRGSDGRAAGTAMAATVAMTAASSSAVVAPPSVAATGGAKPRGRATPYLTESNRQDIMERIRRGEKQADLAKEYNVSRAAITNLKQRRQMLEMLENSSNAKDREEALKRRRLSHATSASGGGGGGARTGGGGVVISGGAAGDLDDTTADEAPRSRRVRHTPDDRSDANDSDGSDDASIASSAQVRRGGGGGGGERGRGERGDDDEEQVTTIDARDRRPSAGTTAEPPLSVNHRELNVQTTSRLLSTLLEPTTSDDVFRSAAMRHTRLLLEEAIGWSFSRAPQRYEPFALAVGNGVEAATLLAEYLQMEPASASATLRTVEQRASASGAEMEIVARVPAAALRHGPVFVFLDDLVDGATATGKAAATTTTRATASVLEREGASEPSATTTTTNVNNDNENASDICGKDSTTTDATVAQTTHELLFLLHALVVGGLAEQQIVAAVALCDERAAQEIGQRFPDVQLVAGKFLSEQAPAHERHRVAAYRARRRAMLRSDSEDGDGDGDVELV